MPMSTFGARIVGLCVLSLWLGQAQAGRPLSVEDANVNEAGKGHIETWWARVPSSSRSWFVAPAWSPAEGLELAATVSRDMLQKQNSTAVQAKFRLTPSQENGCNFGAIGGWSQAGSDRSRPFVNGLFSCNKPHWGSLHSNLGAVNTERSTYSRTWGLAWEYPVGEATFHLETFGQQQVKPTRAMGLRFELTPQLQIDGSLSRQDNTHQITLGGKWMF